MLGGPHDYHRPRHGGSPSEGSRFGRGAEGGRKPKSTALGKSLVDGMEMVAAHIRGEVTVPTVQVVHPNVKAIRTARSLSQAEFASKYGFNLRTLQDWEMGRARPPFALLSYLRVIEREPAAVERALAV